MQSAWVETNWNGDIVSNEACTLVNNHLHNLSQHQNHALHYLNFTKLRMLCSFRRNGLQPASFEA